MESSVPGAPGSLAPVPNIEVVEVAYHTDYRRGERTTCWVKVRNNSPFPVTVYARVWLGYQIAGIKWYDATDRVWEYMGLKAGEERADRVYNTVKSDCPVGPKVGRVYVYAEKSESSKLLAYQNKANAANIVA